MTDPQDPAEALAAIRDARGSVVDQMNKAHWSLDLLYGLSCSLIVGGQGLPSPYNMAASAIALCGLAGMMRLYQKQTGVWVSGVSPKRARWVAAALGVVLVGLLVASIAAGRIYDSALPSVGLGVVAGLASVGLSRLWMRVYRREMAEEGA